MQMFYLPMLLNVFAWVQQAQHFIPFFKLVEEKIICWQILLYVSAAVIWFSVFWMSRFMNLKYKQWNQQNHPVIFQL